MEHTQVPCRLRALRPHGRRAPITTATVWPFEAPLTVAGLHAAIHETLRTMRPRARYRRHLPGYLEEEWVRLPLAVEIQTADGTWTLIGDIPAERWPVGSPVPKSPGVGRVTRWLAAAGLGPPPPPMDRGRRRAAPQPHLGTGGPITWVISGTKEDGTP